MPLILNTIRLKKRNAILQNSDFHVYLDYTLSQSFLHVPCGSCSIIMVYLKKLYASAKIDLDNSIFMKLQASSSTKDVANEL